MPDRHNTKGLEYVVYVLSNQAGRRYTGITSDLEKRVRQHNEGLSKWTRGRGPWHRIWNSPRMTLTEARKLENRLKRQKNGRGLAHLTDQANSSGS